MLDQVVDVLVRSKNEAADDALLEALRMGNEGEQRFVLAGLLRRKSLKGLSGVVALFDRLPDSVRATVLREVGLFHQALRECGRSEDFGLRCSAMRIVALGRQGKLAYVLSENLQHSDETLSRCASDAIVGLAEWVALETQRLQRQFDQLPDDERRLVHEQVTAQRPDIEAAIARAMSAYRSRHSAETLRAALLLCDWAGSKTLQILTTNKHGGQSTMVRRLQQLPTAETVDAFLLGASHGGLRSHFGTIVARIDEPPVLDALLRRTHWLKDHQLQICLHQVTRGSWWSDDTLQHDCSRRVSSDVGLVAEWIAASGEQDVVQDMRLIAMLPLLQDDLVARLRLVRIALRRKRGTSVDLLKALLNDPDERIVRLAAREIVRRRPRDFENVLLKLMPSASDSVRRVIGRAIGQTGFDQFWQRFDHLDRPTRQAAGRAMLKLLPDAPQRLARRLSSGPMDQRLKALHMVQDLDLGEQLRQFVLPLCQHPHPRVRSKAVALLVDLPNVPADVVLDKALADNDPRVRANAIEVLESRRKNEYVPLLAQRARSQHGRERANAIKALHRMKVGTASSQLLGMLRDERADHRVSAIWAMRSAGIWQLLDEVGRLAKEDSDMRVRRYALNALRAVMERVQSEKAG